MTSDDNTDDGARQSPQGLTATDTGAHAATRAGAETSRRADGSFAIEPGAEIGRFVVEEIVGQGGMGVVVLAHDPTLDRKVAIKLLRRESFGASGMEVGRTRLLREAQAMAKLAHPNVVAVHEVGTVGDRVFVAMEYVDGGTLRDWCERESRSAREILEVFEGAARGLAAAHGAGLVHRDFKPENVLVGDDGRVLVTDFGIVGIAGAEVEKVPRGDRGKLLLPSATPLDASLTQTGALLGTPMYMAPEQHRGEVVEQRADQFSFCVALFEALYGQRPFAGDNYPELEANVSAGNLLEPPERAAEQVPARVRKALLRGLRPDPADRYRSLEELLADLGDDPAPKIKARFAVVGIAVAGAAFAAVVALTLLRGSGSERSRLCEGAQDELVGVWDSDRRDEVRRAFSASGRSYAEDSFALVTAILDQRARAWSDMHRDACRATHVEGEQTDELLDLRMHCLRGKLDELKAVVDLFAEQPQQRALDRAVEIASGMSPLDHCADSEALLSVEPLPDVEPARAKVADLRKRLQKADAVLRAGAYERSLEIAKAVAEEARALGFAPVLARALVQLGDAQSRTGREKEAEQTLTEAAQIAAQARDDHAAAHAWIAVMHTVGYRQSRYARALALVPAARAAVERAGSSGRLRTRFLLTYGALLTSSGKQAEGQAQLELALRILENREDTLPVDIASCLNNIGAALLAQGKYAEAREHLTRALEIRRKALGPRHPRIASALVNLASTIAELGDIDTAQQRYQEAIAILSEALGPDHPNTAAAFNNLGADLCAHGRCGEAREYLERALQIRIAAYGPESPHVATTLNNLGESMAALGEYAAAREHLDSALAIRTKSLGPEHARIGSTLSALGNVLRGERRNDEAREKYEQALAIWEKALGPKHPRVASVLVGIGECHLDEGRAVKALPYLERAVSIAGASQGDGMTHARARFALARALWDSRRGRDRALSLAKLAGDAFAEAGKRAAADQTRVADWLAARGVKRPER